MTAAALLVLALLAGYWVLHCADAAMTPEFCAKALFSVVLILLAGPLLGGWLTPEVLPAVASTSPERFFRPPEASRA